MTLSYFFLMFISLTPIPPLCCLIGFPFYVVFVGSFIKGLTGSFAAIMGLCLANIFDITDEGLSEIVR